MPAGERRRMSDMRKVSYIIFCLLALLPSVAHAQWSFDVPSVEAYINDHKEERSLLIARATLEQSNALLHEYSKTANADFKEISVELDKYTRAFDVIDVLYQTLRTSLNAYDTYDNISPYAPSDMPEVQIPWEANQVPLLQHALSTLWD